MAGRRALITVYDKRDIAKLAKGLFELGFEIVSTPGTAKILREAGIPVTLVEEVTSHPEMLGGRVKTLHPRIHAAILASRERREQMEELGEKGLSPIDIVVINLYPFEEAASREDLGVEEVMERMDVGGHALMRAAAKNHRYVTVVTDPSQYDVVLRELRQSGDTTAETRRRLAVEAMRRAAAYDVAISEYVAKLAPREMLPEILNLSHRKALDLRYGENPHQRAALYQAGGEEGTALEFVAGRQPSFNNIRDMDAGLRLVYEFEEPAAAIVKHMNPCGAASAENIADAYRAAYASDPASAYGGVVAVNREVGEDLAGELAKHFYDALVAPSYSAAALQLLKARRRLVVARSRPPRVVRDIARVSGGLLVQEPDVHRVDAAGLRVVTRRSPAEQEARGMLFAWRVVKHVRSNAVVLAVGRATVGVGAGQMSRVDAVRIAVAKAGERVKGSVMASDGFFPFRDSIDEAARAGVTAVIQPGGSVRDSESIQACDEQGLAMVFTGVRCFSH